MGLNGALPNHRPTSSSSSSSSSSSIVQPQQTRHARRLYVGNIPDLSEDEVHAFFRDAIRDSIVLDPESNPNAASQKAQYVDSDPIISVYINRERRFVFLEFKTMEITSACLALDGIDVMGRGKVKVKRPNDYNAALAPLMNASSAPRLDTARLGIVSPTVPDGPNKIFIGGLPYHLQESQVLELMSAFGAVKAFHLVKQDNAAVTSKGYCFVEYSDPNITQVACMGLNGMDMGGGKQLSCRMAATHFSGGGGVSGMMMHQGAVEQQGGGAFGAPVAALPAQASVVDGVDVDALLMAALGGVGGMAAPMAGMMPVGIVNPPPGGMGPMMGGMMMQQPGAGMMMPGIVAQMGMYGMVGASSQQQQQPQMAHPTQGMVVADPMAVANAAASALDAAFGGGGAAVPMMALPPTPAALVQQIAPAAHAPTRVLVLLNMVADDDLATDEDHKMLGEEVREEVSRYGKLVSMKVPRPGVRIRRYRVIFFIAMSGAECDLFPQYLKLFLRLVHDGAKTKKSIRTGGVRAQRHQEDLPRIRQSQRCHGRREGTEGARVRSKRRRCHVLWGGGLCQG
jgi:RNA recognition motif-containing protein